MNKSPEIYRVTWQLFDSAIYDLVKIINSYSIQVDCIVAIARGGCIPAVAISHKIPNAEFYVLHSRVHKSDKVRSEKLEVPIVSFSGNPDLKNKHLLLVDDVLHTGATARACLDYLENFSPKSICYIALIRDTYGIEEPILDLNCPTHIPLSVNSWIVFPWE
jgi:hypoxanthine phosphoribosyltransferase